MIFRATLLDRTVLFIGVLVATTTTVGCTGMGAMTLPSNLPSFDEARTRVETEQEGAHRGRMLEGGIMLGLGAAATVIILAAGGLEEVSDCEDLGCIVPVMFSPLPTVLMAYGITALVMPTDREQSADWWLDEARMGVRSDEELIARSFYFDDLGFDMGRYGHSVGSSLLLAGGLSFALISPTITGDLEDGDPLTAAPFAAAGLGWALGARALDSPGIVDFEYQYRE